jgi:hypothetical protein
MEPYRFHNWEIKPIRAAHPLTLDAATLLAGNNLLLITYKLLALTSSRNSYVFHCTSPHLWQAGYGNGTNILTEL